MDREKLIQAVVDALTVDDDNNRSHTWTTRELCMQLGWNQEKVRAALVVLKEDGKLGVTRKPVVNLSGHMSRIPAYYLIDESKNPATNE